MSKISFNSVSYTEEVLANMSGSEQVKVYNSVAAELDEPLVKRFSTKDAGVKRTWSMLERYQATKKPAQSLGYSPRKRRGTNLQPLEGAPVACREGSKQALMVDLLSRDDGATMKELLEALSGGKKAWTEASVRSGFGWDMKQKGYGVMSKVHGDEEVFHLVLPKDAEGKPFPIPPHRPLKNKPKTGAH